MSCSISLPRTKVILIRPRTIRPSVSEAVGNVCTDVLRENVTSVHVLPVQSDVRTIARRHNHTTTHQCSLEHPNFNHYAQLELSQSFGCSRLLALTCSFGVRVQTAKWSEFRRSRPANQTTIRGLLTAVDRPHSHGCPAPFWSPGTLQRFPSAQSPRLGATDCINVQMTQAQIMKTGQCLAIGSTSSWHVE